MRLRRTGFYFAVAAANVALASVAAVVILPYPYFLCALVAAGWMLVRLFRVEAVTPNAQQLLVRNPFRTYRWTRDQIRAFELEEPAPWWGWIRLPGSRVRAVRSDGRPVPIEATFRARLFAKDRDAEKSELAVPQARDELESWRAPRVAGDGP